MDLPLIPDKLYFKIGEVAQLTGIKPHVLRYWESEFGPFRPSKSRARQRQYQRKEIELVFRLKELLYQQGFTIAGAKKKLRESLLDQPGPAGVEPPVQDVTQLLQEVREDLLRLRRSLDPIS